MAENPSVMSEEEASTPTSAIEPSANDNPSFVLTVTSMFDPEDQFPYPRWRMDVSFKGLLAEEATLEQAKLMTLLNLDLADLTTLRNHDAGISLRAGQKIDQKKDEALMFKAGQEIIGLRTQNTSMVNTGINFQKMTVGSAPKSSWIGSLLSPLTHTNEDTADSYERIKNFSNGYTTLSEARENIRTFFKPMKLYMVAPTTPDDAAVTEKEGSKLGSQLHSPEDLKKLENALEVYGGDDGSEVATDETVSVEVDVESEKKIGKNDSFEV